MLYFMIMCILLSFSHFGRCFRRPKYPHELKSKLLELIELINTGKVHRVEWVHKGTVQIISFTEKSRAKVPGVHNIGINSENGIMLKHFWLDNTLHSVDTFAISKINPID